MALQKLGLAGFQLSVGRAKQFSADGLCAAARIQKIGPVVRLPAIQVVVGMAAHGMAFPPQPGEELGMLSCILPYAEKSAPGIKGLELIQHPGGNFRNGAVVEGEEKNLFIRGNAPGKMRKEILNNLGSFHQVHGMGNFFNVHGIRAATRKGLSRKNFDA
jgi:hypothetical protein